MMIAVMFSAIIVACKDDFTEEDFLRQQAELKALEDAERRARDSAQVNFYNEQEVQSYIAALNAAGDLLSVTFLVRENGNPVSGVAISLTTGTPDAPSNGRAKVMHQATTDASGNATFENVTIGQGTVSFEKQGYLGTTADVDFGYPSNPIGISVTTPTGTTVMRYSAPPKRYESGVVQMFSADAANENNTATITGRVTIETDVTNLAPEIPTGIVLRANLAALSPTNLPAFMTNLAFADNSGLGEATIAADGTYTMTVPATAAGTTIQFIVPNINGTRRTAVNAYDNGTGTAITLPNGPEYRDVPVAWGPQASGQTSDIPTVVGARAVIPAPPAAGSGLTFDFTRVPRGLNTNSYTSTAPSTNSGVAGRITSRGNYKNSLVPPTVTITSADGNGGGATAVATMRTYLSAVTVTDPGEGYTGEISLTLQGVLPNGGGTVNFPGVGAVQSVGGSLPSVIDLGSGITVNGFGPEIPLTGVGAYESIQLVVETAPGGGEQAIVEATFVTEVASVQFTNPGSGYTTAPTVSLQHSGANIVPAVFEILELQVNWEVVPNNTASTNYAVLPTDFMIYFPATQYTTQSSPLTVAAFSTGGVLEIASADINSFLTVENGDVVKSNPGHVLRTDIQRASTPHMVITPRVPSPARLIIEDTDIDEVTGAIISDPAQDGDDAGYATQIAATIQASIAGAPGSGATVTLTNTFTSSTKEWTWDGSLTRTADGSGYLRNLNRKAFEAGTAVGSIVVQPGKTYHMNVNYGTGVSQVNID